MSYAIVQHGHNFANSGTTNTVTLGATPTVGNLLIAFVQWFSVMTNVHINTTGWTIEKGHTSSGTDQMWVLSRYVQSGDTATTLNFQDGVTVSTFWSATVVEVSGVTGVHATDWQTSQVDAGTGSATTHTSSSLTPTAAGGVAIIGCCGDGGGGGITSFSAGWTSLEVVAAGGSNGYSFGCASQIVSAAFTVTVTYVGSNSGRNIGTALLNAPSGGGGGGSPNKLRLFPTSASVRMLPQSTTYRGFPTT